MPVLLSSAREDEQRHALEDPNMSWGDIEGPPHLAARSRGGVVGIAKLAEHDRRGARASRL